MTLTQLITVTKVSDLNDRFRERGFNVLLTGGVRSVTDLNGLMEAIRGYSNFNEDNDPWLEHDFGKLDWNGDKIFWKIDYYNEEMTEWEDPLSPECHRVMTVMLANEY